MIARLASRALVALAFLLQVACAGAAGSAGGLGAAGFRDEDRVVVGRYTDVLGVAVSRRFVYVAGAGGVAVYDTQFDAWLPPRSSGGLVSRGRLTAMAADPLGEGVWLGTVGEVVYYQPGSDFVTRTPVSGIVAEIAFDRRDPGRGALVRVGGGWYRVSNAGSAFPVMPGELPAAADRITAGGLEEVYRRYPALRDLGRTVTVDAQNRDWPITSGAVAPDRGEVFLGTTGNGLYRVDPNFLRGQHLPYGLLSDGAGALARALDGVWIAPSGNVTGFRPRGGLTFARDDLRQWRWIEDDWNGPLAGTRTWDLDVRGSVAWLATDRGLARIDTRSRVPETQLWAGISGLPSDVVLSVAAREGGAWAGTAQGLVWVSDTGRRVQARADRVGTIIASGVPIRALLSTGDTLWMATPAGLLLLPPGERRTPVRSTLQAQDPRLASGVTALASSDSIVVIGLAQGDVTRVNLRTGTVLPRLTSSMAGIGEIVAIAQDARSLWVAGRAGVAAIDRRSGVSRFLAVGNELPGEVQDIVLGETWAWVATRYGLVRLARTRDGLPR